MYKQEGKTESKSDNVSNADILKLLDKPKENLAKRTLPKSNSDDMAEQGVNEMLDGLSDIKDGISDWWKKRREKKQAEEYDYGDDDGYDTDRRKKKSRSRKKPRAKKGSRAYKRQVRARAKNIKKIRNSRLTGGKGGKRTWQAH